MEEIGLLGSKAYVNARKQSIAAAINLDVFGFGDSIGYGLGKAVGTDCVQRALLLSCADQLITCMDSANYPTGDDRSFQAANIPVISIGSAPRIVAHQAWLILNGGENSGLKQGFIPEVFTIIHTPSDTISKIEPATLDRGVQLVLNTILRLDATLK
jgi:Zn-dependent M28 family amino/carboxypeptidase